MNEWLVLALFFLANFAAASSGAIFKPGDWYENLDKPPWRPANWMFPVVWSILYVMIAVSGWLIWREAGFGPALAVYGVQLVLNAGWSAIFFGAKRADWGLVHLVTLWMSVVTTIGLFAAILPLAAWLLVPYALWATFAGVLNFSIVRRNPDLFPLFSRVLAP